MSGHVDKQLGNYRLIQLLGQGGFAEVYLGEQVFLKSYAAIKVLHTHLAQEDQESFLAEARTLVQLIHPHIVRLLDFGIEGTVPYLVMDYAPNGTLRKLHPKGERLPLSTVVSYVKQIADALQYAHDEKLIHRDIKPENILLGRHNELLLSDFGIALIAQSTRMQSTQAVVGTAYYMAPEQLQGKPRMASDQYALGVVVYEWLSGTRPFNGSFSEIASQHMLVPPPSLREKVPTISPAIEEVVMTALAKDPHQRFWSIRAFANALEQACSLPTTQPASKSSRPPEPTVPAPTQYQTGYNASPFEPKSSRSFVSPPQPPTIIEPSPKYSAKSNWSNPGSKEASAARKPKRSKIFYPRIIFSLAIVLFVVGLSIFGPNTSSSGPNAWGIVGGYMFSLGLFLFLPISWVWVLVIAGRRRQWVWFIGIIIGNIIALSIYLKRNPGADRDPTE